MPDLFYLSWHLILIALAISKDTLSCLKSRLILLFKTEAHVQACLHLLISSFSVNKSDKVARLIFSLI